MNDPPAAVGIVDGEFYQRLAISPKEILRLLDAGIPVFGSSSMGALRAVELESCGMIGVGAIFEQFRSGALEADDEVAMTFCPETLRPTSEPLVNIRVALRTGTAKDAAAAARNRLRIHYPPSGVLIVLSMLVRALSAKSERSVAA